MWSFLLLQDQLGAPSTGLDPQSSTFEGFIAAAWKAWIVLDQANVPWIAMGSGAACPLVYINGAWDF